MNTEAQGDQVEARTAWLNAINELSGPLEGLAQIAMQFGLKHSDLKDAASLPRAFVMAALEQLQQEQERPSNRAIGARAGVDHKTAGHFRRESVKPWVTPPHINKVLDRWRQEYGGKPINLKEGLPSLKQICDECGEQSFTAALQELTYNGSVKINEDMAYLCAPVLVQHELNDTTLAIIATSLTHLARSIAHNLEASDAHIKYIQRIYYSHQIPTNKRDSVLSDINKTLSKAHQQVIDIIEAAEVQDETTPTCTIAAGVYANSDTKETGS
ncbi:MAG: hypothetical protein MI750_01020 [Xanthomonadales bacterium]|nr:hypothetical protein [Xanthomonadales bacterium]